MKIFIGCSSSDNISKQYLEDSKKLFKQLFQMKHDLVFGGCCHGIMKEAYEQALLQNREIIGICSKTFQDDLAELKCSRKMITSSESNRTNQLIEESDICLFLPGGIGTIQELFTAIDSKRNNEMKKPIIIYNSGHYFDRLLDFLTNVYQESFASWEDSKTYQICTSPEEVIAYFNSIQ